MAAGENDVVRLADIYAEQIRTSERVRLILEQLPDHEARLRSLERWRYSLPLAAGGIIASVVLALAGYLRH